MRVVMLILVAAALSGCVGEDTDFETVEAPSWDAGHAYSYNMGGSASAKALVKVNGETVDEDQETEPIPEEHYLSLEVLTSQASIGGEAYYLLASSINAAMSPFGGEAFPGSFAVRQSDLAAHPVMLDPLTTVGDTSAIYLDFPLAPGKTWSYELPNDSPDDDLIGDFNMKAEAVKGYIVNTPLGDMEAVQVVTRASFPDLAALRQEAVDEFENAGFTNVKVSVDPKITIITDYAPAIKSVARESTVVDLNLRIQFTDGSDNYDLQVDAFLEMIMTITGASLNTVSDLGQEGAINALLGGRQPTPVEGTATVPVEDVTLTIAASEEEVNAGAENSVDFTITASGVPENMFVAYELVDALGDVVAEGEGTEFSHSFDAPGVHYARATVTNGAGYSVAVASVPVVADYSATVQASCAQATLPVGLVCSPVAVPLRPGQFTASIDASAMTAGMVGLPGTFAFHQMGSSQEVETTDGTAELGLDGLPGAATDGTVSWSPTAVGVLEEVTYTIDLDYSLGGEPSMAEETMNWQALVESLVQDLGFELDL